MNVRPAREDDHLTVRRILDAAVLRYGDLDTREVLVAVEDDGAAGDGDRVLGALVLDGRKIEAVAVRRRRRGQGIGTALAAAAAERRDRLVAEFDAHLRPFYESLGFDVERDDGDRYRGTFEPGRA